MLLLQLRCRQNHANSGLCLAVAPEIFPDLVILSKSVISTAILYIINAFFKTVFSDWYREPTSQIETEALKENRELLEQAEKNMNQKGNRSTCGNAAAGLIVLPTRLNATTSQTSLTSGTTQSGSINGENTIPQQSIPNHLVSSQKQDAFSSQSKNNADPFAAFTPSNFSSAPNFTVAKTDLFANFSPKVPASTNSNVTTQLFPNVNSTSSSMFSNSSINTATNLYGSNSGDKYAALAELDGLFKSTGIKTSNSDSLEKQIDDNIVTKANISIVNASQWVTSFTPQISYPNIPVVGTHGWPTSTPFQDNAQSLNPFLSSASGVQNPGVFNRFPNPFASYPVMTTPSNVHQFPEPVSLANPESRNPFLSNPPQSFTMNPFSGSTNSTSISYPQSATNSFSPVIHPVSSFPAKMNNPMNGIVGQLGTTGFLDNNGDADRSQMSSFNPF
ncbi:unnamed protein product [Heterobilharzia americana]|nr:unnamed protein product [Heterobilharzia americana]